MAGRKRKYERTSQKSAVYSSPDWTTKELSDLAGAMQLYGPADVKRIAAHIKTKSVSEVGCYMQKRLQAVYKKRWGSKKDNEDWPCLQRWMKFIRMQMDPKLRKHDYSREVIVSLWQKWYDEIPEPKDQQLVDVKMIYKYFLECMKGEIPAQLPPRESVIVLCMFEAIREIPKKFDFKEEFQFIRNFKGPTKVQQMTEKFKESSSDADEPSCTMQNGHKDKSDNEASTSGQSQVPVINLPDDLYRMYEQHKGIIESFNPMMVPLWLLVKEQDYLKDYFENKDE